MQFDKESTGLFHVAEERGTSIYRLVPDNVINEYFIVSSEGTRHLMRSPEVVGYDSYMSMIEPTTAMLDYLSRQGMSREVNILTILRGGLNYPLEECCHHVGLQVDNMNFLSCERVFEGDAIVGLDVRYTKLAVTCGSTLLIGDIFATGNTFVLCFHHVMEEFYRHGGSIRRVVFFTVGGTNVIPLTERITAEMRALWPDFEGFTCVCYEGMFSVYADKGSMGVNVPDVDFGWKDGVISPEFRSSVLKDDDALFEKCIIYDGGARRYEISDHIREVTEYWEGVLRASGNTDMQTLVEEKLGYPVSVGYDEWLSLNGYKYLASEITRPLYELEQSFVRQAILRSLHDTAVRRLQKFTAALERYRKH